ncbi:acyl-CoA thioesterase [Roseofilum casamattae]|uniref:Thioesterase family protein n=1 Tax=Roseofilum casamattae BLCC-M143 TaxID=3022442 RepID=A0ABT7BRS1_9CYAN|nr:thioesterase family protein [Roseofilum casamattae]MDJ1181893.1 thioesterase family protein [Roseofilum casamattae BLCC-M143]
MSTSLADGLGDRLWHDYAITVYPHHTDYAGVVWHGTYIQWMEQARVEYFNAIGIDFTQLVKLGCDLAVVDLSARYHRPLRLGMDAKVKTRLAEIKGVRQIVECQICSLDEDCLYLSSRVILVPVDRSQGKILRKLPKMMAEGLSRVLAEPPGSK